MFFCNNVNSFILVYCEWINFTTLEFEIKKDERNCQTRVQTRSRSTLELLQVISNSISNSDSGGLDLSRLCNCFIPPYLRMCPINFSYLRMCHINFSEWYHMKITPQRELQTRDLKSTISRTQPTSRKFVRNHQSSKDPTLEMEDRGVFVSWHPRDIKFETWHFQAITYNQKVGHEPTVLQGSNSGDGG